MIQRTTTRYFRWDDAGAPTLTGAAGSLIALLKTLLVGTAGIAYDGKPACGWTTAWEDTNVIVFQNNPELGNGCFVRIDDSSTTTPTFNVYESMTTIDLGTFPCFSAPVNIRKSSSASTTQNRPWILVGDERTYYLYTGFGGSNVSYSTYQSLHGAGDFTRFDGIPGIFGIGDISSGSSSGGSVIQYLNYDGTQNTIGTSRLHANYAAPFQIGPWSGFGTGNSSTASTSAYNAGNYAMPGTNRTRDGSVYWSRFPVSTLRGTNIFAQGCLGIFRGLYWPLTGTHSTSETSDEILSGQHFFPQLNSDFTKLVAVFLSTNSSSIGCIGIETERSWDIF